MKLTLSQRVQLAIIGRAFSHSEILKEGDPPTPFYIAKCKIHGHYLDYPHGFKSEIRCPMCKEAEGEMASEETPTVNEGNFYDVLERLRDVRRWATTNLCDPWAFRQALITVMSIDTTVALESGIDPRILKKFDMAAGFRAEEFLESIPEEAEA